MCSSKTLALDILLSSRLVDPKLSRQQHATVPDLLIATDLIKSTDTMLASPGSSVSVDNEMTHRGLDG
uniref:Uncharacterized protein n=1 Tax=Oryza rufipogon TaxID=4529 RepID=A0A0E0MU34_ORYRU